MATIISDAMHRDTKPGYQTRSLFFSDMETIRPVSKAHKPADSGVAVGNGARFCSFQDVT
ncbi:hypothetical protein EAH78_19675 [Pseudomonas arsenicoxydans]|uniref:Uncharacterized protein n=1 Tax=Pseudomonas arsenicoxydans TaxID=702115 RepID=A0A502HLU0_9PSED|nr:hypothetical protein EAH78_19675 [Pseudomonas arsenicoxydans]